MYVPKCATGVLAALCLLWLTSLAAQEPTDAWKRQHTLADGRIEGFDFERNVGVAPLTLVDFSARRGDVDLARDERLEVGFFTTEKRPFQIVAREIHPSLNYYMEGKGQTVPGANRLSSWSADVLRNASRPIDPTNLGVLVQLGNSGARPDDARDVAPVALGRTGAADPSQPVRYAATFLPDTTITSLTFKVFEGCGANRAPAESDGGRFGNQYRGRPVTIPFTVSRRGLQTLTVEYQVNGIAAPSLKYCFWHEPAAP